MILNRFVCFRIGPMHWGFVVGKPWTDGMPVVDAPQSATPKPVTFIIPYYCNPSFLRQQIAWWGTYPAMLRPYVSAIIVDDGSPEPAVLSSPMPFQTRLFRIDVDVRWNWLAARNIAMNAAQPGWCMMTDIDHVVPVSTADAIVYGRHDEHVIYAFSRIEHTGEKLNPHPNSFLMTREMFWRVGGYDETLSGKYGSDGDWRRRCAATAPIHVLRDRLIRHEHVGDSSTTRYLRKQPEDAVVKKVVAARGKRWQPKTLSFPYHEVTA